MDNEICTTFSQVFFFFSFKIKGNQNHITLHSKEGQEGGLQTKSQGLKKKPVGTSQLKDSLPSK